MPKTVWRPYPFLQPPAELNKFENAAEKRGQVIDIMTKANRPMTLVEIAAALEIAGTGFYNKARRYVKQVAEPTHEIHRPKRPPDIGWTLKQRKATP